MEQRMYSIDRSFNGSTILLTGATGFVGGSLLERILRLKPGPERVFLLVRGKQGLDPQARIDAVLESPLFTGLESKALGKVHVVSGDVTVDGLSLSDYNRELLLATCTHVFHAAALISFASQLESAVRINLLGTRYLLRFVQKMTKIESLTYVSTAYVNCTRNSEELIEERIYPTQIDPVTFTDMIESMPSKEIERRSEEFVGEHANTYTFTKQMAENLMVKERGRVPLSIVRPSIVLNSWKKPISGWVDNVNSGACGFIAGLGKGLFRTFQANPNGILDIIPVDMVVSTILAASIHATKNPNSIGVFHCTSASINPTTWLEYCKELVNACRKHPCVDAVWYPKARPRSNWLRNALVLHAFQLLPAYLFNVIWQFKCPGEKHLLLSVQQKYAKGCAYTSYFSTRQWTFSRSNANVLSSNLAVDERNEHPMDPSKIEWDRYFEICVLGTRQYFHKEPSATTERARRQMMWLKIVAALTPFLAFFVLWYLSVAILPGYLSTTTAALFASFIILFTMWL